MTEFRARKRFGQHFLRDQSILQHMARAVCSSTVDHLVEIGPGQGALTDQLLSLTKHLDVIEIDRDLVKRLQHQYADCSKLHIHQGDVLDFDFAPLQQDSAKLRVIGNLPYNISTPLLFHLFDSISIIQDMHFLLQKEVAERMAAPVNSHHYGRLSVMTQYYCNIESLFDVPPESFDPPPKVNSAFIRMTPHKVLLEANLTRMTKIVKQAFNYRRKTINNSLKGMITAEQFVELNIDSRYRPQQLTVKNFVDLSNLNHI